MNRFTTALACSCLTLASLGAQANETTKQEPAPKSMSLEECKQQMSMEEKNAENKGVATKKQDKACADMIKKDAKAAKSDNSSDPMKK